MFATPEQFSAAQKASLENLFAFGAKAFEGVEKLVELNLSVAKSNIEESADKLQSLMSVKDVQELASFQTTLAQPVAEKALSYSRMVYDIAASTQNEFQRLAEAQIAESNKSLASLIDSATKNAPAGSETAVAMVKSAISAASSAYDSMTKVAKQVAEMTEANVSAAANAGVKAASAATSRTKKAA